MRPGDREIGCQGLIDGTAPAVIIEAEARVVGTKRKPDAECQADPIVDSKSAARNVVASPMSIAGLAIARRPDTPGPVDLGQPAYATKNYHATDITAADAAIRHDQRQRLSGPSARAALGAPP